MLELKLGQVLDVSRVSGGRVPFKVALNSLQQLDFDGSL